MRTLDIENELEFTIHGLDEIKITHVHKDKLKEEDKILTAVLQNAQTSSLESQESSSCSGDTTKRDSDADDEEEFLVKMSYNLAEREESLGESTLLQHLKTLKEEAWAMKKARKLRKLKKVQFQDLQPVPFQRKCCSSVKKDKYNKLKSDDTDLKSEQQQRFVVKVNRESAQNTNFPTESQKTVRFSSDAKNKTRPVATLHSIDMFRTIIPSYMLPVSSSSTFYYSKSFNKQNAISLKNIYQ